MKMRKSPSKPNFYLLSLFLLSSFLLLITRPVEGGNGSSVPVKVNVGVILDAFQSSTVGKVVTSSIDMALSDFYSTHPNYVTRLVLNTRDSNNDVVASAAAGEKVISNLARMVVIVWFFVVLILTQSYMASLTSLLTVQQLQPAVTDVKQLIRKGEYVGYQERSFVLGILKGLGFDESKLIVYNSPDELDELFNKGIRYGGIAAAFDEVPYTKLFLAKYCSKYTTTEPTFKTDGFGFVFLRGSPLVSDISRAVLNVTEGDKMKQIEEAWFGKQSNCPETSTSVTSNSLDLNSFWGLFLIAGVVSTSALLISVARFVYKHREKLQRAKDMAAVWSIIRNLLRIYDEKDDDKGRSSHPTTGAPSPSANSDRQEPSGRGTQLPRDQETTNEHAPPSEIGLNIKLVSSNHERQTTEITEETN